MGDTHTRFLTSRRFAHDELLHWFCAVHIARQKRAHSEKEIWQDEMHRALQTGKSPQGFPPGYPAYEAITVNGITEIIEHKKMEPIFYLTDDPAVWKQYQSIGCG